MSVSGNAAADPALEALLRRTLEASLGASAGRIEWLEAQLGLRRFARVHLQPRPGTARDPSLPPTLIARIEAPEDPAGRPAGAAPEPALEPIRALLEAAGLPVPARHGDDPGTGIDLLEDVGSLALRDAAAGADATELRALYAEACALVPRIQRVGPSGVEAFHRRLDDPLLAYKAETFLQAFDPALRRAATTVVRAAFARVADAVREAPARLAHRDFQSANLHLRPGAAPGQRLVMIDLQGAFLAPPEYDLVSLLRDSYVELAPGEVAHQIDAVRTQLPDAPKADVFARRFDLLTLTRKGKDLGRFLYAARVRGDRRFLPYVPATIRALRAAAVRAAEREPAFGALAEIVAELPEDPCGR